METDEAATPVMMTIVEGELVPLVGINSRNNEDPVGILLTQPRENETCSITMDLIGVTEPPFSAPMENKPTLTCAEVLPCGHRFNAMALIAHYATNAMTCPMCRSGLPDTRLDIRASFANEPWIDAFEERFPKARRHHHLMWSPSPFIFHIANNIRYNNITINNGNDQNYDNNYIWIRDSNDNNGNNYNHHSLINYGDARDNNYSNLNNNNTNSEAEVVFEEEEEEEEERVTISIPIIARDVSMYAVFMMYRRTSSGEAEQEPRMSVECPLVMNQSGNFELSRTSIRQVSTVINDLTVHSIAANIFARHGSHLRDMPNFRVASMSKTPLSNNMTPTVENAENIFINRNGGRRGCSVTMAVQMATGENSSSMYISEFVFSMPQSSFISIEIGGG